jgi:hypothetical protein
VSDPAAKPQRKSFGPESDFLQTLKGKLVRALLQGEMGTVTGKLVWVDRYSYGILETGASCETLVLKSACATLRLA